MSTYRDLNDYEIMYLVEEENDDARELLFEKYKPIIYRLALSYQKEAKQYGLELEDLIQEAYVGLSSAVKNYNSDNNVLFYTYAIVSMKNRILNVLTAKSSTKHRCLNQAISLYMPVNKNNECYLIDITEDKNEVLPQLLVEENETENIIHDFILSLDFPHSCILELKMNGFSNCDIASLLDYPLKNVTNYLFRIRKQLKQNLKDIKV